MTSQQELVRCVLQATTCRIRLLRWKPRRWQRGLRIELALSSTDRAVPGNDRPVSFDPSELGVPHSDEPLRVVVEHFHRVDNFIEPEVEVRKLPYEMMRVRRRELLKLARHRIGLVDAVGHVAPKRLGAATNAPQARGRLYLPVVSSMSPKLQTTGADQRDARRLEPRSDAPCFPAESVKGVGRRMVGVHRFYEFKSPTPRREKPPRAERFSGASSFSGWAQTMASNGQIAVLVDGDGAADVVAGDQWFDLATRTAHPITPVTVLDPPSQYSRSLAPSPTSAWTWTPTAGWTKWCSAFRSRRRLAVGRTPALGDCAARDPANRPAHAAIAASGDLQRRGPGLQRLASGGPDAAMDGALARAAPRRQSAGQPRAGPWRSRRRRARRHRHPARLLVAAFGPRRWLAVHRSRPLSGLRPDARPRRQRRRAARRGVEQRAPPPDLTGDGRPDLVISNKRGLDFFEQQ